MDQENGRQAIMSGETALGIELGSTRIKAVLIDRAHRVLASGSFGWENRLEDGIWTYHESEILPGVQACYADLARDVKARYGVPLETAGALGVSGMMHGYLPFDRDGRQLAPFRTWRNTITGEAAEKMTALLDFNIPQRWSTAHLFQAVLNGEEHVGRIAYLTTLAGFLHWRLTGKKVMGVGEAAGMFPIDSRTHDFDGEKLAKMQGVLDEYHFDWTLRGILPTVLTAGEDAGTLTREGALLLDPTGTLRPGIPMCPPEGDAGTGMTATNAVAERTGNVSAGTSIFGMIVLERPLSRVYPEIDLVTTPSGHAVAMAHCNNCTSDLDDWVGLFSECLGAFGCAPDKGKLYETLFRASLDGEKDAGGLMACNYLSGEHVTHFTEGRPLFARTPNAEMTLANFMRAQLYAALATLKTGLDLLIRQEGVRVDHMLGHGGFFKTPGVGQRYLAAAIGAPVSVMETAGEGGPYGMALLAAYRLWRAEGEKLETYLDKRVFAGAKCTTVEPDAADIAGFETFMERYTRTLAVERAAVENI